eukprot:1391474-Heterocapsa_arctica.AAC.1
MAQDTPSAWHRSADSSQTVTNKTGRRAARAHVRESVLRDVGELKGQVSVQPHEIQLRSFGAGSYTW